MYNVYQHWDPLKVCLVGRSYSPEFYNFISNTRIRSVLERIAQETEEDYQKLIALLQSFGVTVLRPNVSDNYKFYLVEGKILPPPMTPRDYTIMLGSDYYHKPHSILNTMQGKWNSWRGTDWPEQCPTSIEQVSALPDSIKKELLDIGQINIYSDSEFGYNSDYLSDIEKYTWGSVLDQIKPHVQNIYNQVPAYLEGFNSAESTRVGRDIYVGTRHYGENLTRKIQGIAEKYPGYRWHSVNTGGHSDGTYCPVAPGLIVSLRDIPTYADTFPDWEVIYLPGQSWSQVQPFLELKTKNKGKWWVPGEEFNDEFTNWVESWIGHWVGYVEETVFDVNMLVINERNVVCNNYNKQVFDAFERHGITPHVINFRHRYFWDGGLHCITSDIHREGIMKDYFPKRG